MNIKTAVNLLDVGLKLCFIKFFLHFEGVLLAVRGCTRMLRGMLSMQVRTKRYISAWGICWLLRAHLSWHICVINSFPVFANGCMVIYWSLQFRDISRDIDQPCWYPGSLMFADVLETCAAPAPVARPDRPTPVLAHLSLRRCSSTTHSEPSWGHATPHCSPVSVADGWHASYDERRWGQIQTWEWRIH